jgi:hypothetical protein
MSNNKRNSLLEPGVHIGKIFGLENRSVVLYFLTGKDWK